MIIALLLIPWALTHFFLSAPQAPAQEPIITDNADPSDVTGTPYELAEGFVINIPAQWELLVHDEERSVDRYRFERNGSAKGIFTVSFYPEKTDFQEVIEARYGSGFVTEPKPVEIGEMEAVLVHSAFFEQGDTADMIVQINETTFLSLYGVFLPDGEEGQSIKNEIRYMQESLRAS